MNAFSLAGWHPGCLSVWCGSLAEVEVRTKFRLSFRSVREHRHHIFFVVSLVTLLVLGSWWTIFLRRNVEEIHQIELDKLQLEGRLAAFDMRSSGQPRLPEGSKFEVTPKESGKQARLEISMAPLWPQLVLRPKAEVIERMEQHYRVKIIQVAGEGVLLLLLIMITIFMLYYMVLVEGRVRRSMENFLSTVTHELKTPIAGVKALLQTLAMRSVSEEKSKEYLEMGLQESARLQHLVENVLAASRLDRNRMQIKLQPVDLRTVLEREIEGRRRLFAGVEAPALHCEQGLLVSADPEALRIVMENLLENACKYSSADPRIVVNVERNGGTIHLLVTDNGIGLEAHELELIFKRFYRATEKRVKAVKGSGLGLYIARSLARAMGGELSASSPGRGRGSTFSLRLRAWQ